MHKIQKTTLPAENTFKIEQFKAHGFKTKKNTQKKGKLRVIGQLKQTLMKLNSEPLYRIYRETLIKGETQNSWE